MEINKRILLLSQESPHLVSDSWIAPHLPFHSMLILGIKAASLTANLLSTLLQFPCHFCGSNLCRSIIYQILTNLY